MFDLKVFVIDDSLNIRAMVEQLIEREAHACVVGIASDATDAIVKLHSVYPNLITLDLAMPRLGGLDFLDQLRDQRHAPIVVVSSATTEGSAAAEMALAHGAVACFDKAKIVSDSRRFMNLLRHSATPARVTAQGGALRRLEPR